MSVDFSALIGRDSMSFVLPNGKPYTIVNTHPNFDKIRTVLKERSEGFIEVLETLVDIPKVINNFGKGKVTVVNGIVTYEGEEVHNVVSQQILYMIEEGFSADPLINFLENLMQNPSKQSVDELYSFLEKGHFTITDDGHFLAYKRVTADYKDIHTKKIDNSIGAKPTMLRNKVNDNRDHTCSEGLHFCSISYLPHFGSKGNGDRTVIVKINPKDVVSIPRDYNDAKGRCCGYEVVGEHTGADTEDHLKSKPVMNYTVEDDKNAYKDNLDDKLDENFFKKPTAYELGYAAGEIDGAVSGKEDGDNNESSNSIHPDYEGIKPAKLNAYERGVYYGYKHAYEKAFKKAVNAQKSKPTIYRDPLTKRFCKKPI